MQAKRVSILVHYNSIITAHAILMIFFMVGKQIFFCIFNFKFEPSLNLEEVNNDNNNTLIISNDNNNGENENSKDKYVKILVNDPFNNRDIILKVSKKQKGIYI